jgi:hypothetical protein
MECCNETHLSITLLELYIIMDMFGYGSFDQKCAAVVRGTVEVKEV